MKKNAERKLLSGLLTFNQLYKVFGAEPTSSNDNVLYTLIENIGRSVVICTGLQNGPLFHNSMGQNFAYILFIIVPILFQL
jgi:hypothetical protein